MGPKVDKKLFQDRKRTNILNKPEQQFITYLLPRIPAFVSPNGLTAVGFIGSVTILASFLLAEYVHLAWLLLGILGFFVQWFGDSLDGRIAIYRNKSRKWYGFALDLIMDWISTILIGLGYVFYAPEDFKYTGFFLVSMYGWAMIISLLRYKITDKYTIDAGPVGPTEIRLIISVVFLIEVLMRGSINYLVIFICLLLFFINIADTRKLLNLGDIRDAKEKEAK